ncbi:MAG TPA: peptidylprolyl isomerase [Gemmatimonadales bacterium]|nr:peptidylprolyl isomerase [Gemmatimonadales bacterium]
MRRAARVAALLLGAAGWGAPLAAQGVSRVADLAQLLALEDRREFDAAALRRAARHSDALIRAQAAVAIGRIGDPAGAPVLLTLLSDPDTGVRAEAAFAMGLLHDTLAVEELTRRVDAFPQVASDPDQLEMVTALARIGGARAAAALDALLQRHPPGAAPEDPATSRALLETWRLRQRAPAARLVDWVRGGSGEGRRNATYSTARLAALGALPDAGVAAAALLEAAGDSDALTRAYAARGLTAAVADSAHLGRATFVGRLRVLLGDGDPQVRITALRSLATYRDSTLAGLALQRLVDPDPNAVVQAVQTLGALGGSRATAALEERFARGASFAVQRSALAALAQTEPARVAETGASWRTSADWRLRAAFAEALGGVQTAAARARLGQMAADTDPRVVETALASLEQIVARGNADLLDLARARLASADVYVRAAAIDVLDRERDPALVPDLVAAYRRAEGDDASDARLAVVTALGHLVRADPTQEERIERDFLGAVARSADYLVRRAVAEQLGAEVERRHWGGVYPVETGRSPEDYRDAARTLQLPALEGGALPQVTIETDYGTMVVALYAGDAPLTVQNFLRLVDRRFFDGGRWHRVVPNFVIQDGDPRGDGNGGPGWVIRDEINRRRYDRGAVGMALSGPDTGGSQFFVTHSPQPHLDGGYTVFGHLAQGSGVLDQIVQGDRIRRITR